MQRTCIFRALSGARCLFLKSISAQELLANNIANASVAMKSSKASLLDLNIKVRYNTQVYKYYGNYLKLLLMPIVLRKNIQKQLNRF